MIGLSRSTLVSGLALIQVPAALGGPPARVQIAPPAAWVDSGVKPDYGAPDSPDAKKGFDILLADDQFSVDEQSRYFRLVYRITSAYGVQNGSSVSVTYDPEYESIDFHRVGIVRGGEEIDRLDLDQIKSLQQEKDLERYQYNGQLTALILLEDVRVGDIVDYAYTRHGSNPVFAGHFCYDSTVGRAIPAHRERIRLVFNKARSVSYRMMGDGNMLFASLTKGDLVEYVWHAGQSAAVQPDQDLAQGFEPYPYLSFSDYHDWHAVAEWARPLYKLAESPQGPVAGKAAEVSKNMLTDGQKALAVLQFVQEDIRYLGIEIGTHSHRPNPPGLVLERRYGDCKDKVVLLCAMLNSLGIKAVPALTHTGRHFYLADQEPSPLAFNHVIARIKVGRRDYWVDPTLTDQSGDLPHRALPPYIWALPVEENVRSLQSVEIPDTAQASIGVHESYTIGGFDKQVTLGVRSVYAGTWADGMRGYLKHETSDRLEKEYVNFRARFYPKIRMPSPPTWTDDSSSNQITVTAAYVIDDFMQPVEGTKFKRASFYPLCMRDYLLAPTSLNRTMPMFLAYPLNIRYEAEITSPWTASVKQPAREVNAGYFRATASYSGHQKTTSLKYTFIHDTDQVPAPKVAEYADKLSEFRLAVSYAITVDPEAAERNRHFSFNWTMAVVVLVAAAAATYGGWRLYLWRPGDIPATAGPGPEGLEGWLALVGIGTVLRPIMLLFAFVKSFWRLFDSRVWEALTSPASLTYKPGFGPLAYAETVSNIVMIALGALMIALFLEKRRLYPGTFIVYWCATLLFLLADRHWAAQVMGSGTVASSAPQSASQMSQAIIVSLVWIPYMLVSRRVKATFVN